MAIHNIFNRIDGDKAVFEAHHLYHHCSLINHQLVLVLVVVVNQLTEREGNNQPPSGAKQQLQKVKSRQSLRTFRSHVHWRAAERGRHDAVLEKTGEPKVGDFQANRRRRRRDTILLRLIAQQYVLMNGVTVGDGYG